jgi:hypothetical protein
MLQISAYLLLAVVWSEAFMQVSSYATVDVTLWAVIICVQARKHWLSTIQFQKRWIIGYLVCNAVLYSSQVCVFSSGD